jgi:hypothetical protein
MERIVEFDYLRGMAIAMIVEPTTDNSHPAVRLFFHQFFAQAISVPSPDGYNARPF